MYNISEDIYKKILYNPILKGHEAGISVFGSDLMKVFFVIPSPTWSRHSDFYLNKRKKLEKIIQIPFFNTKNPVYPKNLYTVYNKFAAYTMPDRRDLKTLYQDKFSLGTKIEILKRYRRLLDYFHSENIVYGDIKGCNMLLSSDSKTLGFCDLDNMKVDDLSIDILSRCASYFCSKYGLIDYKLDSFMFNFLTIEYLLNIYSENYEMVFDFLDYNVVPNFSFSMNKVKVKSIFDELKNISPDYSGRYIIDYI